MNWKAISALLVTLLTPASEIRALSVGGRNYTVEIRPGDNLTANQPNTGGNTVAFVVAPGPREIHDFRHSLAHFVLVDPSGRAEESGRSSCSASRSCGPPSPCA